MNPIIKDGKVSLNEGVTWSELTPEILSIITEAAEDAPKTEAPPPEPKPEDYGIPVIKRKDATHFIARLCHVEKKSVKEAVRLTGISQSDVSVIRTSDACYDEAIKILWSMNKTLLSRFPKYKMELAVDMSVNKGLTNSEIDLELGLKPGSTWMLTRTELWQVEKARQRAKKGFVINVT